MHGKITPRPPFWIDRYLQYKNIHWVWYCDKKRNHRNNFTLSNLWFIHSGFFQVGLWLDSWNPPCDLGPIVVLMIFLSSLDGVSTMSSSSLFLILLLRIIVSSLIDPSRVEMYVLEYARIFCIVYLWTAT